MPKKAEYKYMVGDFETTVYDGQEFTEVWASAVVAFDSEDVKIFHSIAETWDYLVSQNDNICIYYHNLKFDGSFWLYFIIHKLEYKEAYNEAKQEFLKNKDMPNSSFKYLVSDMGQWYNITIKINRHIIEIRDSLKLLPFSVAEIGKSFKTKHQKLSMEYKGLRYAGCKITDEEREYIANDVLVVKEALEFMFKEGHNKLTIGSCCLAEYRKMITEPEYKDLFPDLTKFQLNPKIYGAENADAYIRKSYHGGYCYVVEGKENKIYHNGLTADVNSLYPSSMHSESGNRYPYGVPTFWRGNEIPERAKDPRYYYFIRIKTRFYIKPGMLPCIQIKHNLLYKSTKWLKTSDIYYSKDNKYHSYYTDFEGKVQPAIVEMTLTKTDFELIKEHYILLDFEILDGCYFNSQPGLFDEYIDKYKKLKIESTGAKRTLAKLFSNNLYGKMATGQNSSFKKLFLGVDESLDYETIVQYDKPVGYIPVGSAVTSYAREFTIKAAQANYHGIDKPGFIYADTDSIHADLDPEELVNIPVDPVKYNHWKLEASWNKAIFVRQKTYIEHIVKENLEDCNPYYNIRCAGMPQNCKNHLIDSFNWRGRYEWETERKEEYDKLSDNEKAFVIEPRTMEDFKRGLVVPGKLLPRQIKGGVVLVNTIYEMR